jgi:glycosyltransferase involved in cell wall biosynthesis
MNITILQGAFLPVPPRRGGAVEKMWHRLGLEFAARGHRVTHVSRQCDGLPASERTEGVQHVRVAGFDQPRSALALKFCDLRYTLRAVRAAPAADVVVTNTFFAPLLLRRAQGAICVDVARMPRGQLRLYRRAARFRANSSAVRAAILAELPSAASRVRVIPNPLPAAPARPVAWAAKSRTILYAGRLHPEKGIELLLTAFVRVQAEGGLAGWRLVLAGPADVARGGGGEAWVEQLKTRFASPFVEWRAPLFDHAALEALYEEAAVFAYPSLAERGETFGLAPLEAMAWGAVPVVSDLACFRDFVRHEESGLVFDHRSLDPAAALARALIDAADPQARALGESAVSVRVSHAPGAIAEQFLADFATLA